MSTHDQDKALIESLGGPVKLAETLGYEKDGGVQRVQNWLSRGIPPAVKLQRPDLFLRELVKPQKKAVAGEPKHGAAKGKPRKPAHREPRQDHHSDKPSHRNAGKPWTPTP